MKQSFWLNVGLFFAVVLAGALVYLHPPADGPVEYAVSDLAPGAAASVRIERPGMEPLVLERKNATWFLRVPFNARADDFMVQRVLSILQARTPHRFAATDLARFDLEKPRARLVIDTQQFEFGLVSELSREQYVRTGEAVYSLPARYGLALPSRPDALASRRLLAPEEVPVRIAPPGFSVARTGDAWSVDPGAAGSTQDEIRRWVDGWLSATAQRIEPYRNGDAAESVPIELANGESLRIGILSRKPEVALLRPDQRLQYFFPPDMEERLLSPPSGQKNPADRR